MKLRDILDEITGKEVTAIKTLGKPILTALAKELGVRPKINNNNIDSTFRINKAGYMSVDMEDGRNVSLSTKNDLPNELTVVQRKGIFKKETHTIYYKV